MIRQFTVKNFKSIKDEACLDMRAASIHEHDDSLILTRKGERYLPVSVIYGPNGGGKSNMIGALKAFVERVTSCYDPTLQTRNDESGIDEIEPYAFARDTLDLPTEFDVDFRTSYTDYRYTVAFHEGKVVYEFLDYIKPESGRPNAIFERAEGHLEMKGCFSKLNIPEVFSDYVALIAYLGPMYSSHPIIHDVWEWFRNGTSVISNGEIDGLSTFVDIYESSDLIRSRTLDMCKEMDLDIEDVKVVKDSYGRKKIFTVHSVDGFMAELPLESESRGTVKLFKLIPLILRSLEIGETLVIDELDALLHPVLLEYIVNLYRNPCINRNGAQLIFASHDLSTMRADLFRRDEIWFAAKGCNQNTGLYSLVEFKDKNGECPRAEGSYARQYLKGRYGADPYLTKIIEWER